MKIVALVLAVVFLAIGVAYLTGALQIATSDPAPGKHHLGHFVLFTGLAVLSVIWSRFAGKAPAKT